MIHAPARSPNHHVNQIEPACGHGANPPKHKLATPTVGLTGVLIADMEQTVDGGLTTLFSLGYVEPEHKSYTVAYIISGAVLATGITLFIIASKNKKKAGLATAFLDMEKATTIQRAMVVKKSFPTIGIKLQL